MSTFDKFKCRWRRSMDACVGCDETDEYCVGDGNWCNDKDNIKHCKQGSVKTTPEALDAYWNTNLRLNKTKDWCKKLQFMEHCYKGDIRNDSNSKSYLVENAQNAWSAYNNNPNKTRMDRLPVDTSLRTCSGTKYDYKLNQDEIEKSCKELHGDTDSWVYNIKHKTGSIKPKKRIESKLYKKKMKEFKESKTVKTGVPQWKLDLIERRRKKRLASKKGGRRRYNRKRRRSKKRLARKSKRVKRCSKKSRRR